MPEIHHSTSAKGTGALAARDIKAPVTIENKLTVTDSQVPLTGVSVSPPFNHLPRNVRGRTDVIDELLRAVRDQKMPAEPAPIWLLHGLGGVGKSTIALAVISKAKSLGVRGYWINATDRQIVQASLWRIARDLAGPESQLTGTPVEAGAVDAVWDVLERAALPWMIVVDNADEPQVLAADGQSLRAGNGWLRSSRRGFVLVTSRVGYSEAWGAQVTARRIDPLSPRSGGQVLLDLTAGKAPSRVGTRLEAEELASRLFGVPLALRAAGRYLKLSTAEGGRVRSFRDYRMALDSQFDSVIDAATTRSTITTGETPDPRELVMATWEISLDFLAQRGFPDARLLLRLLSCYASRPVPLAAILVYANDGAGPPPGPAAAAAEPVRSPAEWLATSSQRLDDVLTALSGLALVERTVPGSLDAAPDEFAWRTMVDVHPLVGEVMGKLLSRDRAEERAARDAVAMGLAQVLKNLQRTENFSSWENYQVIEPHLRAMVTAATADRAALSQKPMRALANALGKSSGRLAGYASPGAAEEALSVYAAFAAAALGGQARATKALRAHQAFQLWRLGKTDEAARIFRSCAPRPNRLLWNFTPEMSVALTAIRWNIVLPMGDETSLTVMRYLRKLNFGRSWRSASGSLIASTLSKHGQYEAAETEYRAIFEEEQRRKGADHPHTLMARYDLASALRQRKDFEAAEQEMRAVMDAEQRVLGRDHPNTLTTRSALASILSDRRRYEEAEHEGRTALHGQRRVLGDEHPDTLVTRMNLAFAQRKLGNHEAAEKEYRAVLDVRQRTIGDDHPDTLLTRFELALALRKQCKYEAAEREYRAVLDTEQRTLGAEHANTLVTHYGLAMTLHLRGQYQAAEKEFRAVLDAEQRTLGEEHPNALVTRSGLASTLREQGQFDAAAREFRAVLDAKRRTLGEEHPHTATARREIALTLGEQDQHEAAEKELRIVLDVRRRALGEEHPDTVGARYELAAALHMQGQFEAAEKEYRAVVDADQRILGHEDAETLNVRHNLAHLWADSGKRVLARNEFQRLFQTQRKALGRKHPDTLRTERCLNRVFAPQKG